jgi:hypothetical protein
MGSLFWSEFRQIFAIKEQLTPLISHSHNTSLIALEDLVLDMDAPIVVAHPRRRSLVWVNFEEEAYEEHGVQKIRAKCRRCNKIFICTTTMGTGHLYRHVVAHERLGAMN